MMENTAASSLVCSSDVAAFVDALETIGCNESVNKGSWCENNQYEENIVICISEPDAAIIPAHSTIQETDTNVTDIEDACADAGSQFFNPDTRKLKAIMQQLVAQSKAIIIKKSSLHNAKGTKQFKSDVWNWFGDVRLFITENDAVRLKIPYYFRPVGNEQQMICKVFVGCFRCNALFMYDSQHHSTSTLRYHVRACTRPKECIFVSDDKALEEENQTALENKTTTISPDGSARVKRFRTDPRKQKEVIEQLFQKQKAIITRKSFMNMKGNRRFKSDVWNWFGDIRLLISRSEAKKLKIPYYIRKCGDEQMVLSKVFVGCFKCLALFIHDSQKSTSTLRYHIRTCSRPKERKKRTTPNIVFIPNKKNSVPQPINFNENDVIPAHDKLLNCALSTESSLDVIQEPEFRKILQLCISIGSLYGDVNIDSLLCATPTLTSFILNDLYVTSVNEFYTEFQHSYGATYRLSVWIDEQVKFPFISVHCSYINAKGEFKDVIIHTDDFDYDAKSPEVVCDWFNLFLADQPVIPFKRLIAIDNDSNLVSVFKDEQCVKCIIQNLIKSLQQTVSKGVAITHSELPDFTNLLSSCVELVNYFDQISDQYQLPEELIKCPDDKWTSILSLFRSIEDQYENILSVLNDIGSTHLLSVEKSTLKAIVKFFKVFEDAIPQLSGVTKPTLNLVVPWTAKIQKLCQSESEDPPALKQLKSNLLSQVTEHVLNNITLYHHISTFLDPRFKSMTFGFPNQQKEAIHKVKCLVKECMESPNVEDLVEIRKPYYEQDRLTPGKSFDPHKNDKASVQEVDRYLSESFQLLTQEDENKFELLKFWTQRSEMYPNLTRIAQWILSCPASCVEENETFWSNEWQVHCPRLPLQPDNVNKVLFVKSFRNL